MHYHTNKLSLFQYYVVLQFRVEIKSLIVFSITSFVLLFTLQHFICGRHSYGECYKYSTPFITFHFEDLNLTTKLATFVLILWVRVVRKASPSMAESREMQLSWVLFLAITRHLIPTIWRSVKAFPEIFFPLSRVSIQIGCDDR